MLSEAGATIDRQQEVISLQVAHEAGVAPPVYAIFDNGIVCGYAPGKMLQWEQMWDDKHIAK